MQDEEQFEMRCWDWETLQAISREAGFSTVSSLDPARLGARSDRLVALAVR